MQAAQAEHPLYASSIGHLAPGRVLAVGHTSLVVLVDFLKAVTKRPPWQRRLEEEFTLAYGLREQSTWEGRHCSRSLWAAAGRITPTVRKQREGNAGVQLTFSSLYIPGLRPLG